MKITVVGMGYVGISNAVLLARFNEVYVYDVDFEKIKLLQNKKSPIVDEDVERFLKYEKLNFKATTNMESAYIGADYIIVATPTDYDAELNYFDTSSVELVIENAIYYAPESTIVIKSTVPIGYTESIIKKYNFKNIIFSPEFLREGHALYDNLNPSRIIVGFSKNNYKMKKGSEIFAKLLAAGADKDNISIKIINSTEAEAVKLFANTYLALRISYFNELDTYAEINNLNSKEIIEGIGLDSRIGLYYNNPSFGYGGYCLPKDTKQLRATYEDIPNKLITAIVESNRIRKNFIANQIIALKPHKVGIYRLNMKSDSDNCRQSAILDIIEQLKKEKIEIIIFEPFWNKEKFSGLLVYSNLNKFKADVDLIVANRYDSLLDDVQEKVYSRDLFNIN